MRPLRLDGAEYRALDVALVRTVHHGSVQLPEWPDPAGAGANSVSAWVNWLRQMWSIPAVANAVEHASPHLDEQVRALCAAKAPEVRETWRTAVSVARYAVRLTGRPTPAGLFAGVTRASFAERPQVSWGAEHQAVAHADAGWLAKIIGQLESRPELLARIPVVVNSVLTIRGDHVIVPYEPHSKGAGMGAAEISLRRTAAVHAALDAARSPIRFGELVEQVHAGFPDAGPDKVKAMLAELVVRRALISSLHAPSTEVDALGHLVRQLETAGVSAAPAGELKEIQALLERHGHVSTAESRAVRAEAAVRMRRLARVRRHPVAVDLRLDGQIVLPSAVARDTERAAELLARLSPAPYGSPAWGDYHQRFYERFGIGALVPLLEVVGDSGIGWPDGYPGADTARRPGFTRRDETLMALAQAAALDGRREVVLDEQLVADVEQRNAGPAQLPAHLELCVRLDAAGLGALERGDFRLTVVSVSRAAGVLTGRFLHLLDPRDRKELTDELAALTGHDETLYAQLSFPPLDPATAHVTRAVRVLPTVISLAEHRGVTGSDVLSVQDLAVGCDSHRLYLAAPALGKRIEARALHALSLRTHTPPLARLMTELSQAQGAQVADFDWGAASALPFLPRLRSGRIVLCPARWRLDAAELSGREVPPVRWNAALTQWRSRRFLPRRVLLLDGGDWRLPLDLDQAAHRQLLREHLRSRGHAVLEEGPGRDSSGWCEGRAHEVVVTLATPRPTPWPRLPRPTTDRVVSLGTHGRSPGTGLVLLAKLYGDPRSQDTILTRHLPDLLAALGDEQPAWWFLRFREGRDHSLRLRLACPDPAASGTGIQRVSAWADDLRQRGLLREVVYAASAAETGRWGSGVALAAAEAVFHADSCAVLTQLAQRTLPDRRALTAANFMATVATFTGSPVAGAQWLIDRVPATGPSPVPRPEFAEAVRLADPRDGFAALRRAPGGDAIVDAWASRSAALAAYRKHLPGPHTQGIDPNAVLDSLLHTHYLRAFGIGPADKAVCLYLARAAALAFSARRTEGRP